ncbi:CBO0543 family protein [Heyndrickxia acidiproducens]|uniref:CBO0543 family protein n=1 Tax=Heyndrickxia acidiproducens TaxID=1121084 RepID=UPI0012DD1DA6|nr:CBO0543 family protein [Heyndrickxia acidiproducens]
MKRKCISTMVFAALVGTYLDIVFTSIGLYAFPIRPLPEIFNVNIAFTLAGLPIMTAIFLYFIEKCRGFGKGLFILFSGLLMAVVEKLAESFGIFSTAAIGAIFIRSLARFFFYLP